MYKGTVPTMESDKLANSESTGVKPIQAWTATKGQIEPTTL